MSEHVSEQFIIQALSDELGIPSRQIVATLALLDEGATVPFIARYRKEVTGNLDDVQLRQLEERLTYLRELEARKIAVIKSIDEQEKLTPQLKAEIERTDSKTRLEELYLPYKPRRTTKGQLAIEAGIEPLADLLLGDKTKSPEQEAAHYINEEKGYSDIKAVLDGAKYILMERFSEDANLLAKLRQFMQQHADIIVKVIAGKEHEGQKFADYFEHTEAYKSIPSHRMLAILRGRNEGILSFSLDVQTESSAHPCEQIVSEFFALDDQGRAADTWFKEVVKWTWRIKLLTYLETDLINQMRDNAEEEAINVFAANLKDLLLAPPAGAKATIGLDPGLRTGVKVAVIDATGKVLDHCAIYPTPPQNKIAQSEAVLLAYIQKYSVELIAIGNGTASRETDKFVGDMLKQHGLKQVQKVMVNEAGASIYSASELAAKEFPDLDVTIRGAVSIARRLQDPLAELVKIEPKSIGVGQYQHDVNQSRLVKSLQAVVEDCVNNVGVDLNTASAPLLTHVSGLNKTLAENIVSYRENHGRFSSREVLKEIPRLGDKTFEQAAGFLRINNGDNPLDASAVHPESYPMVTQMAATNEFDLSELIGNPKNVKQIQAESFVNEEVGLISIQSMLNELAKAGRDPRPEFKFAQFKEGVESIADLKENMILEGVITNVAAFGAFVDVGVHQDGLVHISALSDQFVKDPREVVKAGDLVKVKVMEVDAPRKRIALSMRLSDEAQPQANKKASDSSRRSQKQVKGTSAKTQSASTAQGAMANALAAAFAKQK